MTLESINPTTGELIESFEEISDADLEAALEWRLAASSTSRKDEEAAEVATKLRELADQVDEKAS